MKGEVEAYNMPHKCRKPESLNQKFKHFFLVERYTKWILLDIINYQTQ